jgi:hypothetical protein
MAVACGRPTPPGPCPCQVIEAFTKAGRDDLALPYVEKYIAGYEAAARAASDAAAGAGAASGAAGDEGGGGEERAGVEGEEGGGEAGGGPAGGEQQQAVWDVLAEVYCRWLRGRGARWGWDRACKRSGLAVRRVWGPCCQNRALCNLYAPAPRPCKPPENPPGPAAPSLLSPCSSAACSSSARGTPGGRRPEPGPGALG